MEEKSGAEGVRDVGHGRGHYLLGKEVSGLCQAGFDLARYSVGDGQELS